MRRADEQVAALPPSLRSNCQRVSASSQASNVQLKWAAGGGGLLAETSSDSDSSNRSYYGETKLHFLSVRC